MSTPLVPLSQLLARVEGGPVEPEATYSVAGVFSFGRGLLTRETIRGVDTKYKTMTRLEEGDLVYSKLGAFEGAVAVVPEEFAGRFVSPEFPVFKVSPDVDPRYLDHVVSATTFADQLNAVTTGVGARQKRVGPASFMALTIPLPDLSEQYRVSAHLDALTVIDPVAERAAALAAALLPAARNDAITDLGDVPRRPLGDLLRANRSAVKILPQESYRRIGIYSWGKGFVHRDPAPGADLGSMRYFTFPKEALMLSNIQAWEGAVAVTGDSERNHVCSNRFLPYVVRREEEVLTRFVAHILLSDWGLGELQRASPGTQVRNRTLGQKLFEAIRLPIPPIGQQRELSAILDQVAAFGDRAWQRAELARAVLPAARNEVFSSL